MPLKLFNCTTGELEVTANDVLPNVLCVSGDYCGWHIEDLSKCDLTHIDWDMQSSGDLICPKCGTVAKRGEGEEGCWWTGTNIIWYMIQHPEQEYDESLLTYKQAAERIAAYWAGK